MAATTRSYGGVTAAERTAGRRSRLVDAGLELMGTRGIAALTVRGLAEESGLAARYVYESFPQLEDLQVAVFDVLAEEAVRRSLAALAAARAARGASARALTTAVLTEMVDLMLDDTRKGRVLLLESRSSAALAERVQAETLRFAGMLAATAETGDPLSAEGASPAARLNAHFLIGGMGTAIAAVLTAHVVVERAALVEQLVGTFLAAQHPEVRGTSR
jgi:AcrR family transcriptional regulator